MARWGRGGGGGYSLGMWWGGETRGGIAAAIELDIFQNNAQIYKCACIALVLLF